MSKIVAEIVMTNQAGKTFVVQVPEDAGFHRFYLWYTKVGELARASNRNNNTDYTCRLEDIPEHMNRHAFKADQRIIASRVNYYDRSAYEELITRAPDLLAGGLPAIAHEDPAKTVKAIKLAEYGMTVADCIGEAWWARVARDSIRLQGRDLSGPRPLSEWDLKNTPLSRSQRALQERRAAVYGWKE